MCECEHSSHFDTPGLHAYGVQRPTYPLVTPYGTFRVCQECLGYGHMALDIPPSPVVAPGKSPLPAPLTSALCCACGAPSHGLRCGNCLDGDWSSVVAPSNRDEIIARAKRSWRR